MATITIIARVGGGDYILQQEPKTATIPPIAGTERYVPATVLHYDKAAFGDDDLKRAALKFGNEDDVWSEEFLESISLHRATEASFHGDLS